MYILCLFYVFFSCPSYVYQKNHNRFYLHQKCGKRKDAADFAICLKVSATFFDELQYGI